MTHFRSLDSSLKKSRLHSSMNACIFFSRAQAQRFRVVAQFGSALDWGSRGRWFESSPPDQKSRGRRGFPVGLFLLGISTIHNSSTLGINRARSVAPSAAWDRWDIAYIQNGPIHSKLHESSLPTWAEGEVSPNNSVTFPKGKPDPDRTVKRWGIID